MQLTGDVEKNNISPSTFERIIIAEDVDTFELDDNYSYIWDLDEIVANIAQGVISRVEKINKRLEEQTDRLNKLKQLNLE